MNHSRHGCTQVLKAGLAAIGILSSRIFYLACASVAAVAALTLFVMRLRPFSPSPAGQAGTCHVTSVETESEVRELGEEVEELGAHGSDDEAAEVGTPLLVQADEGSENGENSGSIPPFWAWNALGYRERGPGSSGGSYRERGPGSSGGGGARRQQGRLWDGLGGGAGGGCSGPGAQAPSSVAGVESEGDPAGDAGTLQATPPPVDAVGSHHITADELG
jgi:hypothetical protein